MHNRHLLIEQITQDNFAEHKVIKAFKNNFFILRTAGWKWIHRLFVYMETDTTMTHSDKSNQPLELPPIVKRLLDRGATGEEIYTYLKEHVGFSHERASQIVNLSRSYRPS